MDSANGECALDVEANSNTVLAWPSGQVLQLPETDTQTFSFLRLMQSTLQTIAHHLQRNKCAVSPPLQVSCFCDIRGELCAGAVTRQAPCQEHDAELTGKIGGGDALGLLPLNAMVEITEIESVHTHSVALWVSHVSGLNDWIIVRLTKLSEKPVYGTTLPPVTEKVGPHTLFPVVPNSLHAVTQTLQIMDATALSKLNPLKNNRFRLSSGMPLTTLLPAQDCLLASKM